MAKYRKIAPSIWNDAKFRTLSDNARLVFFLLLTHPQTSAIGTLRAYPQGLAPEMGWSLNVFCQALGELQNQGMVICSEQDGLLWLPNFMKYNAPESPNVLRSWVGSLDQCPECELKKRIATQVGTYARNLGPAYGQAFAQGFAQTFGKTFQEAFPEAFKEAFPEAFQEAFPEAFPEAFGQPSPNQEQEQEQDFGDAPEAGIAASACLLASPREACPPCSGCRAGQAGVGALTVRRTWPRFTASCPSCARPHGQSRDSSSMRLAKPQAEIAHISFLRREMQKYEVICAEG